MKCLLWWTRDGKLDEKLYANPRLLLRNFEALVADGRVSVVMAEVQKEAEFVQKNRVTKE